MQEGSYTVDGPCRDCYAKPVRPAVAWLEEEFPAAWQHGMFSPITSCCDHTGGPALTRPGSRSHQSVHSLPQSACSLYFFPLLGVSHCGPPPVCSQTGLPSLGLHLLRPSLHGGLQLKQKVAKHSPSASWTPLDTVTCNGPLLQY